MLFACTMLTAVWLLVHITAGKRFFFLHSNYHLKEALRLISCWFGVGFFFVVVFFWFFFLASA